MHNRKASELRSTQPLARYTAVAIQLVSGSFVITARYRALAWRPI
ncbi:hypothetical protein ACTXGQ_05290 [Marinobacter sp. 1Y8]